MAPPERRAVATAEFDHAEGPRATGGERIQIPRATVEGDDKGLDLARRDPFQVMDSWDDAVIINELKGVGNKGKLVYSFRQQGQTVVGLGKEGVDFCCQLLLSQGQVIRELSLHHTIIGEGYEQAALFTAKAGRYSVSATGLEMELDHVIATKRQPLYITNQGTGEARLNPHWFEQGSQKALRNARLRLLPLAIREFVISLSQETGRVQANTQQKAEDPAKTPASDAQRKLYAQMLASHHVPSAEREKALAWLASKRHSMATLTQQIDALASLIETRTEAERLAPKPAATD